MNLQAQKNKIIRIRPRLLLIKQNKICFIIGATFYNIAMLLLLLRQYGSDPFYEDWEPITSLVHELVGIHMSSLFRILNYPLGDGIPISLPILFPIWILIGGYIAIFMKIGISKIFNRLLEKILFQIFTKRRRFAYQKDSGGRPPT